MAVGRLRLTGGWAAARFSQLRVAAAEAFSCAKTHLIILEEW